MRKYGFSFLTALLAAESIILPSQTSAGGTTGLPDYVKLGVFLVTMLLIYVLHLIDENYLVFQEAAATRALVLERALDIELTEIIKDRYERTGVRERVRYVYVLFGLGVALLGLFVFTLGALYVVYSAALFAGLGITVAGIENTKNRLKLKYIFMSTDDWTVEPLNCVEGDLVRITLNNLTDKFLTDEELQTYFPGVKLGMKIPKPISFKEGEVIWQVEDQLGTDIYPYKAPKPILVFESYTWTWDSKGHVGIFQVHPAGRPIPLDRKIIISRQGAKSPEIEVSR